MKIGRPYIVTEGEESFLKARIDDPQSGKDFELWFSVPGEYGRYLCDEVGDPFLLVALQWAISSGQPLEVDAPVSSRLLYNVRHSLTPMIARLIPDGTSVDVSAREAADLDFAAEGVGCGCSLGVDSFCSLLRHIGPEAPDGYRLTHLLLCNVGHFGERRFKDAEAAFHENVKELMPFAAETGLPLVPVNSNVDELSLNYRATLPHSFIQRTFAAVLALQKLFGRYVYASSYSFDNVSFAKNDVFYAETVLVPLMSTDNTEFVLSDPEWSRVRKTEYISSSPLTWKYLDVCWAMALTNDQDGWTLLEGKKKKNCSKCPKCLRTMFTLELLGALQHYEDLFDLDVYRKYRGRFIVKVVCQKDQDPFMAEIYSLMKEKGFRIPFRLKVLILAVRLGVYSFLQKVFGLNVMAR